MAKWIPPKIDYWDTPRPIGGEDLKRIEGNIQWLGEHSLLWYEPSSDVVVQSLSEKGVASQDFSVLKTFQLIHPGRYRVSLEARRASIETFERVSYARLRIGNQRIDLAQRSNWTPFSVDVTLGVFGTVVIEGEGYVSDPTQPFLYRPLPVYVRNVQILGSSVAVPAPTVLIS